MVDQWHCKLGLSSRISSPHLIIFRSSSKETRKSIKGKKQKMDKKVEEKDIISCGLHRECGDATDATDRGSLHFSESVI